MNLQITTFAKALVIVAIIGVAAGLSIQAFSPKANAFYGSLKRDGQPNHECYDHPERCK
jgi:hypothetical protein